MKKSMLTLFAFSALIMSSNIHAMANQSQSGATSGTVSGNVSVAIDERAMPQHVIMPHMQNHMMHDIDSHSSDQSENDGLEANINQLDSDGQDALQKLHSEWQTLESDALKAFQKLHIGWKTAEADLRSHHMDRMQKDQGMIQDMMSKGGLRAVEDAQGNIIGAYKSVGETKGYRYGLFYNKNLNQAPVSVIESGMGTPANVAVSGASSTVLGYLDNPNFNGSMGSPKQIMLLQYTMPAQPIMDHAAPAVMPTLTTKEVKVQSYDDNDNNDVDTENETN